MLCNWGCIRYGGGGKQKRSNNFCSACTPSQHVCDKPKNGYFLFDRFDAYEIAEMLKHFSLLPQDVSLVTVATAAHWLDFDQLASQIVGVFPKETTVAIVGYLLPSFVTQSTLNSDVSWDRTLLEIDLQKGNCFPCYLNFRIYSVSPPPNCFLCPHLQIIYFNIARYYAKNSTCAWGRKKYKPTKLWGQNRVDQIFQT